MTKKEFMKLAKAYIRSKLTKHKPYPMVDNTIYCRLVNKEAQND